MKYHQPSIRETKEFNQIKIWWSAARPRALTVSFVTVSVGTLLAYAEQGNINGSIYLFALLFSLFIQIGTHFINDSLDFSQGVDTDSRIGFPKVTQLGLASSRQMMMGGLICLAIALLLGIPLVIKGGLPLISVLLVCVANGYLYTGGPLPLSYSGLGDFFAFLFYGLVGTVTVYYLQTSYIDGQSLLAGSQVGLFATALAATNNLRDIISDAQSCKKTLAVRFGKTFARIEISFCLFLPFIIGIYWLQFGYSFAMFLPLLTLPLAYHIAKSIWQMEPSPQYNPLFIKCGILQVVFCSLLIVGFLVG